MTTKYIAGYFFLILASNYFNFLGFYKILSNLPGKSGEVLKAKTKHYFLVMNILYACSLALSFIPRFGPRCTSEKVYPACMNWASSLFLINFVFHCVIALNKDYFLGVKREASEDGYVACDDNDKQVDDDVSEKSGEHAGHDWNDCEKAEMLGKKMFRRQMNMYLLFQSVVAIVNVAIQLWGRVFVHDSNFLGCTAGGFQWLYITKTGEIFVGCHMVLIVTQAVMLEQALYKVPKKMGWFNVKS